MKLTINFVDGLTVECDDQVITLTCDLCGNVEHGDAVAVERRHNRHVETHGKDALKGLHSSVTIGPNTKGQVKVSHRC